MYYLLYFVCHPQKFRFDIWAHSTWPAECRWVWCAAHTEEAGQLEIYLSMDPADLHEENGTQDGQQRKQDQPWGLEGSLARVRPSAAARLVLAPRFLTQQAGVRRRTLTTDVVHTHAAVLATQKFVVTHPGCGIERKRVSRRQTPPTHTYRLHPNKYEHFYDYILRYHIFIYCWK